MLMDYQFQITNEFINTNNNNKVTMVNGHGGDRYQSGRRINNQNHGHARGNNTLNRWFGPQQRTPQNESNADPRPPGNWDDSAAANGVILYESNEKKRRRRNESVNEPAELEGNADIQNITQQADEEEARRGKRLEGYILFKEQKKNILEN